MTEQLEGAERAYADRLASLTPKQWDRLRSALERVEAAPSMGSWSDHRRLEDGTRVLPSSSLSPEASDLVQALDDLGLHIAFDWLEWEDGNFAADRPGLVAQMSPAQAAMVIFIIWRTDRHADGTLLEAFERGVVQQAVLRMLDERHP